MSLEEARNEYRKRNMDVNTSFNCKSLIYGLLRDDAKKGIIELGIH